MHGYFYFSTFDTKCHLHCIVSQWCLSISVWYVAADQSQPSGLEQGQKTKPSGLPGFILDHPYINISPRHQDFKRETIHCILIIDHCTVHTAYKRPWTKHYNVRLYAIQILNWSWFPSPSVVWCCDILSINDWNRSASLKLFHKFVMRHLVILFYTV